MEDNVIISKYIDKLAQANHDKILLEAQVTLLEEKVKMLEDKDGKDDEIANNEVNNIEEVENEQV